MISKNRVYACGIYGAPILDTFNFRTLRYDKQLNLFKTFERCTVD